MALKMVDPEVLEGLAEFDSATVQNAAAIVYGGYIWRRTTTTRDRTLIRISTIWMVRDRPTVGYALTSTWMPSA